MVIHGEPEPADPRREGVGGSDSAAVLGMSPWLSRLGLWELKRGLRVSDPPSERMRWGTRLEPAIIAAYEEREGVIVERYPEPLIHPTYPWLRGTPDGCTPDRLVEVKAIGRLSDEWGEEGTDAIPPHYYAQVQHYMILADVPLCDVVVLVGGQELHVWTVPWDHEFCEALIEQEAAFWESVVSGEPPEPDGSEDARRALLTLYPRAERDEIVATPEMSAVMAAYRNFGEAITGFERGKEKEAQRIMAYLGDHAHMVGDGFRADWVNAKGRTDWALVAKAYRALLLQGDEPPPDMTGPEALDAIAGLHTAPDGRRLTVRAAK